MDSGPEFYTLCYEMAGVVMCFYCNDMIYMSMPYKLSNVSSVWCLVSCSVYRLVNMWLMLVMDVDVLVALSNLEEARRAAA